MRRWEAEMAEFPEANLACASRDNETVLNKGEDEDQDNIRVVFGPVHHGTCALTHAQLTNIKCMNV